MRNGTQEADWKTNLLGKIIEKKRWKIRSLKQRRGLLKSLGQLFWQMFSLTWQMWIHIPTFILWVYMDAAFHMSICRCRWILYWHQKGSKHILSTCYFAFQIYSEIILSSHSIPLIAFSHNWFGEWTTWMYSLYNGIALLHIIYMIIHYII